MKKIAIVAAIAALTVAGVALANSTAPTTNTPSTPTATAPAKTTTATTTTTTTTTTTAAVNPTTVAATIGGYDAKDANWANTLKTQLTNKGFTDVNVNPTTNTVTAKTVSKADLCATIKATYPNYTCTTK